MYHKLWKARRDIISIEVLGKKLSFNCILELLSLKNHTNHLIYLFITYTENIAAEKSVLIQSRQFIPGNAITLNIQTLYRRPKLLKHLYEVKIERQVKEIF